jgi:uncharacterized protein YutD
LVEQKAIKVESNLQEIVNEKFNCTLFLLRREEEKEKEKKKKKLSDV